VVADSAHRGHFAVTGHSLDHKQLKIFFTEDAGKTWSSVSTQEPPKDVLPVSSADMPGVGYTADGTNPGRMARVPRSERIQRLRECDGRREIRADHQGEPGGVALSALAPARQ